MKINNMPLSEMSDDQLMTVINAITKERAQRRENAVTPLIRDFHKAYDALCEAGIDIDYSIDDEDIVFLENWDGFIFNT